MRYKYAVILTTIGYCFSSFNLDLFLKLLKVVLVDTEALNLLRTKSNSLTTKPYMSAEINYVNIKITIFQWKEKLWESQKRAVEVVIRLERK